MQICGPVAYSDWKSYQLNLALAHGTSGLGLQAMRTGRVNLLDNGALDELLFMGWKLAEFLDVPFLDHRTDIEEGRHPPSVAKDATGGGDAFGKTSPATSEQWRLE